MWQSSLQGSPVFVDAASFEDVRVFPLTQRNTFHPDQQSQNITLNFHPEDSKSQILHFRKEHLLPSN